MFIIIINTSNTLYKEKLPYSFTLSSYRIFVKFLSYEQKSTYSLQRPSSALARLISDIGLLSKKL